MLIVYEWFLCSLKRTVRTIVKVDQHGPGGRMRRHGPLKFRRIQWPYNVHMHTKLIVIYVLVSRQQPCRHPGWSGKETAAKKNAATLTAMYTICEASNTRTRTEHPINKLDPLSSSHAQERVRAENVRIFARRCSEPLRLACSMGAEKRSNAGLKRPARV